MIEYTPTFTIGYNTPGYLPEMEPYVVQGVADAKASLQNELERHADLAADITEGRLYEDLLVAIEVLETADVSQGWGYTVSDPDREHDLGTHYWITPGGVIEEDE